MIFPPESYPTPRVPARTAMRFAAPAGPTPNSPISRGAADRVRAALEADLKGRGLQWGVPLYIQVFKSERELLVHAYDAARGYFVPWRQYRVVNFSGELGPKLREGDRQAPEGFYHTTVERLNPTSNHHLSFNIGYPNAYDRAHGRTGSWIMVHGRTGSIGCFAMGDAAIEEIYTLVDAALSSSQGLVRVHVFPFRMSEVNLAQRKGHQWESFWRNLKEGYDFFETHRLPPNVEVEAGRYTFDFGW